MWMAVTKYACLFSSLKQRFHQLEYMNVAHLKIHFSQALVLERQMALQAPVQKAANGNSQVDGFGFWKLFSFWFMLQW